MRRVTEALPSPVTPELCQALLRASPHARQEANQRLRHLLAYARGEPIPALLTEQRQMLGSWI